VIPSTNCFIRIHENAILGNAGADKNDPFCPIELDKNA